MEIEPDKAKEGLKTAVEELHNPADPIPGANEPEQTSFLTPLPLDSGLEAQGIKRGPGRPPGAKNKNTDAWREFILSQHRSPLMALAQTYSCTLEQLGKALGLKNAPTFDQAVDLYKLQLMAAKELAPYVHQKMPQAIEAGEGGLIQLVINQGQAAAQGVNDAGAHAFKVLNEPYDENQLVSDADFSDASQSRHTGFVDSESEADK